MRTILGAPWLVVGMQLAVWLVRRVYADKYLIGFRARDQKTVVEMIGRCSLIVAGRLRTLELKLRVGHIETKSKIHT